MVAVRVWQAGMNEQDIAYHEQSAVSAARCCSFVGRNGRKSCQATSNPRRGIVDGRPGAEHLLCSTATGRGVSATA